MLKLQAIHNQRSLIQLNIGITSLMIIDVLHAHTKEPNLINNFYILTFFIDFSNKKSSIRGTFSKSYLSI